MDDHRHAGRALAQDSLFAHSSAHPAHPCATAPVGAPSSGLGSGRTPVLRRVHIEKSCESPISSGSGLGVPRVLGGSHKAWDGLTE